MNTPPKAPEEPKRRQLDYSTTILLALQRKPMYEGTVPHVEKVARRVKGKAARAARKVNR